MGNLKLKFDEIINQKNKKIIKNFFQLNEIWIKNI